MRPLPTVKASVKGGKAAAEIAAGTAAGGPWGAILSAAWAMRHTAFQDTGMYLSVSVIHRCLFSTLMHPCSPFCPMYVRVMLN